MYPTTLNSAWYHNSISHRVRYCWWVGVTSRGCVCTRLALVLSFVPNNCLHWACMFHDESKSRHLWICTIQRFGSDMCQMSKYNKTHNHTHLTIWAEWMRKKLQVDLPCKNMQLDWPSIVGKCFLTSVCVWHFLGSDFFNWFERQICCDDLCFSRNFTSKCWIRQL